MEKQLINSIMTKTGWSEQTTLKMLSECDGLDLIPDFGLEWWINFVKQSSAEFGIKL
jgi:hypothetical protein